MYRVVKRHFQVVFFCFCFLYSVIHMNHTEVSVPHITGGLLLVLCRVILYGFMLHLIPCGQPPHPGLGLAHLASTHANTSTVKYGGPASLPRQSSKHGMLVSCVLHTCSVMCQQLPCSFAGLRNTIYMLYACTYQMSNFSVMLQRELHCLCFSISQERLE